jgi:hypothetical protein
MLELMHAPFPRRCWLKFFCCNICKCKDEMATLPIGPVEHRHSKFLQLAGSSLRRPARSMSQACISAVLLHRHDRQSRPLFKHVVMVLSVLLYGCETWALTAAQLQRLEVWHRGCLRQILSVRRRDRVSDEDLLRRCMKAAGDVVVPAENIHSHWRRRLLRWAGHLGRMEDTRPAGGCGGGLGSAVAPCSRKFIMTLYRPLT